MSKAHERMMEYIAIGLYFRHEALKVGASNVKPWHTLPLEETQIYWDDAKMVLDFKADGMMRIAIVRMDFSDIRYPGTEDERHLVEEIL